VDFVQVAPQDMKSLSFGLSICIMEGSVSYFKGVTGYLTPMDCAVLSYFTEGAAMTWKDQDKESRNSDGIIYAETGSFKGLSSHVIAHAAEHYGVPALIYAHDIFDGGTGISLTTGNKSIWDSDVAGFESAFQNESTVAPTRLEEFYTNVKRNRLQRTILPIAGPSAETLRIHDNDYLDLVFLDGDHTYQGTLKDLIAVWPKLKPGAWLLGHDCLPIPVADSVQESLQDVNGVRRAVLDFAESRGLQPMLISDTHYMYAFEKPRNI